jgi:hypothetical protein
VNPYKSCGGRTTNLKFMEHLVRDLIVLLWKVYWSVWHVTGPTQQFRDYSQPTCINTFLALASQKKRALLLCDKWKSKYYCMMCVYAQRNMLQIELQHTRTRLWHVLSLILLSLRCDLHNEMG